MRIPSSGFQAALRSLSHRHELRKVFDAFVRMAACALAMQTREAEYLEEAKNWTKEELVTFSEALAFLITEMEQQPFTDVLGAYYMEFALSQTGQRWNGEFHTPKPVCDLMARLIWGDRNGIPAEGHITICEPACGSGAMILAMGEACPAQVRRRLRITAIDISRTACDMAFINTTLWGIPTRIIHGNSLSLECWAAWSNIHYLMPWLPLSCRTEHEGSQSQGQPPQQAELERLKGALHQTEWSFD